MSPLDLQVQMTSVERILYVLLLLLPRLVLPMLVLLLLLLMLRSSGTTRSSCPRKAR